MRLLLIEDDPILGEGLRDFLGTEGHVVDWCLCLADADARRGEPFDALLIDWQLPDGSGLDWLKVQRARGNRTTALMLTARDMLVDRVQGLDAGADDYLVKPFAPEELVARLRALARRSAGVASECLLIGPVKVDLRARTASVQDQRIELTAREWALLEALALRPGRIVPKGELERLVLSFDAAVSSNALEVHVSSLRRKLGTGIVETIRGMGYRLGST